MINTFKKFAEWWSNTSDSKKIHILYVFIISGLIYIIQENHKNYDNVERDYKVNVDRLRAVVNSNNNRCDSIINVYASKLDKCNYKRIEDSKKESAYFRKKIEELNKSIYKANKKADRIDRILKSIE